MSKCCKKECPQGPQGPQGPKGLKGDKGDPGESTFLKSNILNVDNVALPPLVPTVVASFLVGTALSPARILNVFSALSVLAAGPPPAHAMFQLRVDGVIQPNIARVTINTAGGDSGSLLALVPVGAGPILVELLGTGQTASAAFTVNAAILVQETTV